MLPVKAFRLLCPFLLLQIMVSEPLTGQKAAHPADPDATKRTNALFQNLRHTRDNRILFGHQDDLAYGVYWRQEEGRSDVQETCGQYPAVFGWDLGSRFGPGKMTNIDSVRFNDMKHWIKKVYEMGGVNTIGWHLDNLVTGGSSWDTTPGVRDILPGGLYHTRLTEQLDVLAEVLKSLKYGRGNKSQIPVIFRPWHEHTGTWFWWGSHACTPEEYKTLFRFTVDYLKSKGVHNVLYAYSPDHFVDEEHYMRNYPGDDYVDVFGLDYYYRPDNLDRIQTDLPKKLSIMARLAAQHGKVAAFTETGFEAIPNENWWTQMLLASLHAASAEDRIAYVLVWRNAHHTSRAEHYYAPYPGHKSAKDFVAFSKDERMCFQGDLPNLYKKPKKVEPVKNKKPDVKVSEMK